MTETTVRFSRIPDDATDWERAIILANDLARTGVVGKKQAKVYAAFEIFDIDRETIQDKLEITKSDFFSTLYPADDNVEEALKLTSHLDSHPTLPTSQEVEDIPADEFDVMRDTFAGDVRHEFEESMVGDQFVTEHGHVGSLVERLDPSKGDATGYLLTVFDPASGDVDRRAIAASRIDEMIESEEIQPCYVEVHREEDP